MIKSFRDSIEETILNIQNSDQAVNAFTLFTFDRARAEADKLDRLLSTGTPLPPLAGVPYAVKNLYDIRGVTTVAGSKVLRNSPAANEDAVLIQRLNHSGAILMGALNMDEFAYGFTTENSHYGATHNPHKIGYISGGSSGGSAAAVAAGMVPFSLGSDTNGSIRVPASLCGVWGLKPTFGRLPRSGSYPFVESIDHLGSFSQNIDLLSHSYDCMQGPFNSDRSCVVTEIEPVSATINEGIQGLRIGVLGGYFEENSGSAAKLALDIVAKALNVQDTVSWPSAELARAAAFVISASEGGSRHEQHLKDSYADLEPLSVDRFMSGLLQPVSWYIKAQKFRKIYRSQVFELFKDWDLLLAPCTPVQSHPIGSEWIEINENKMPARASMGILTQPISFAGCPVIAAPVWPLGTENLPLGIQLIAAPWREDIAFRAAKELENLGVCKTIPVHSF